MAKLKTQVDLSLLQEVSGGGRVIDQIRNALTGLEYERDVMEKALNQIVRKDAFFDDAKEMKNIALTALAEIEAHERRLI